MKSKINKRWLIKFNPVAASIMLSLPLVAQADNIDMKNGVTTIVNGVAVVDINAANSNGISHNIYEDLNVDRNGMIFNNSQNSINTVLAGQIQGNSKLAAGTAKVILNEVSSKKQSVLNGMMEVAGDKAHLIIANPNGITMQGSGFINTEKATLTTGKPDIQNGVLKGYSVNGGTVRVQDMHSTSPTEILARAVVVDGQVKAETLAVVVGNNYVNTDGQVTGTVRAQGSKSSYGIDVSRLGGMYANRISLISTESGVGVRNAGTIAGGAAGIQIDSSGKLINNSAEMKSIGAISLKSKGTLENITGSIASEDKIYIDTDKNTVNNTRTGKIASASDIYVNSGAFDNTNGKVAAAGLLAINTNTKTLTNTGKGDSVGIDGGTVALQTGTLNNSKGQIRGQNIAVQTTSINNTSGAIESEGNIDLISSGNIDNNKGLIRTKKGRVQIATARTFTNSNNITADAVSSDSLGVLAGDGGVKVIANTLDNSTGQISSSGNIELESKGNLYNKKGEITANGRASLVGGSTIYNTGGKIEASDLVSVVGKGAIDNSSGAMLSNGIVSIAGASFDNSTYVGQVIGNKGVTINLTGTFNNHIGVIRAAEGDVEMRVNRLNNKGGMVLGKNINITSATSMDNSYGLMVAGDNLTLAASDINNSFGESFGRIYGKYFDITGQLGGLVAGKGIAINANSFDNDYSRLISEKGPIAIELKGTLSNNHALLTGGGDTNIKAQKVSNNYSTLYSAGDLTINTTNMSNYSTGSVINNNATGVISSDKKITLNVGSNFVNYGWISAKDDATVNVVGTLINHNTLNSDKNLAVTAKGTITNYRDIAAGSALTVKTDANISNTAGSNFSSKLTTVDALGDITNHGNIAADEQLTVNAQRNIYNYSNIYSQGKAAVKSKALTNSGLNTVLGGKEGLTLSTGKVSGGGKIVGL